MTYNNLIIISPDKVIRGPHTGCTGKYEDDWAFCKRGKDMAALGFNNYTIFETDADELEIFIDGTKVGRVKVYNKQVGLFNEDEILEYNPYFTKWFKYHSHRGTKIEGISQIEVKRNKTIIGKNGEKEISSSNVYAI